MSMVKRILTLSALLVLAGTGAAAEGIPGTGSVLRVAYRTHRDRDVLGAGCGTAFARELVKTLAERCGYRVQEIPVDVGGDERRMENADADMIASTFQYYELTRGWNMISSRLGDVPVSLAALPSVAAKLKNGLPHDWPPLKLAVVRDSHALVDDFRRWNLKELANITEVEYPGIAESLDAVRSGACDLMLKATTRTSTEIVDVVRINVRPFFMAVRRGERELHARFERAAEELFTRDWKRVDEMKARCLGYRLPPRRVRVGSYLEPGLCEVTLDGVRYGGNIDYVNRIADAAGWDVEWVDCTYPNALRCLETGDLDALAGVTITEERRRKLDYPLVPTGMYSTYLICRQGAPYEIEHPFNWKDAVIATGSGDQANAALKEYLESRGYTGKIRMYENFEEAVLGFFRGECPIVHAAGSSRFATEKVLHEFEPVPAYVVTTRKRPELGRELQKALEHLKAVSPDLDHEVARRHYLVRRTRGYDLTQEERFYLRKDVISGRPVRIEIYPEVHPLKFWRNGHAEGFVRTLFDQAAARAQLNFEFLPPEGAERARERFLKGECDFWVDYGADMSGLPIRSATIDSVMLVDALICRRDTRLLDPAAGRMAVPEWELKSYGFTGGRIGRSDSLKPCEDVAECVKAVVDGRADCTICSLLAAASALKRYDVNGALEVRPVASSRDRVPFRLVPSPRADPRLVSVMRKLFESFTRLELETAESSAVVDFIHEDSPLWVTFAVWSGVALVLLLFVFGIMLLVKARRRDREARDLELRSMHRDEYIVNSARELEETVELIASRTEFMRNPEVNREHVLKWTGEVLDSTDRMLARFRKLLSSSERHADKMVRLDSVKSVTSSIALAAALTALFAGCSRETRELHIGVDGDFPPWSYVDDSGRTTGFDVELATLACAKLGYRPTFSSVIWDRKKELLESGRVDCLWCGFTTTGREQDYAILGPYMDNYLSVLCRKASGIKTIGDLATKVVGYQKGTSSEAAFGPGGSLARAGVTPKAVIPSPYIEACVSHVRDGIVDAMVIDIDYAEALARDSKGVLEVLPGVKMHEEKIGVGFRRSDTELRDRFQAAVRELVSEGRVAPLLKKYFRDPGRWIFGK